MVFETSLMSKELSERNDQKISGGCSNKCNKKVPEFI